MVGMKLVAHKDVVGPSSGQPISQPPVRRVEPSKHVGRCQLGYAGMVGGEFFVAENLASRT